MRFKLSNLGLRRISILDEFHVGAFGDQVDRLGTTQSESRIWYNPLHVFWSGLAEHLGLCFLSLVICRTVEV